jgi:hypothetical protein
MRGSLADPVGSGLLQDRLLGELISALKARFTSNSGSYGWTDTEPVCFPH